MVANNLPTFPIMRIFLFILSTLAVCAGAFALAVSSTAIQEIEAFMLILISAVLLVGSAIVNAVVNAQARLEPLARALVVNTNKSGQAAASAPQEDFSG